MHILVTGPIRPSIDYVCSLCTKLRSIVRNCTIHVVYWKTTDSDRDQLASVADTVVALNEPTDAWIASNVHARTIQQCQLGTIDDWTPRMFKMFHGIKLALEHLRLPDDAIVMRVRTDLYIRNVNEDALNALLIQPNTFYFCPRQTGGQSCDWFGISTVDVLRKLCGYSTFCEYNDTIRSVYNAEQVILHNSRKHGILTVPIQSCIQLAICRDSGYIHVYD